MKNSLHYVYSRYAWSSSDRQTTVENPLYISLSVIETPPEHTDVFLHILFHLDLLGNKKKHMSLFHLFVSMATYIAMVRGELFNSSLRKNCTMKNSLNEMKEERNGGLLGTEKWKETQIDRYGGEDSE